MTYIKKSKIQLIAKAKNDKNYISHIEFTPPFKVTRPFYDEDGKMTIMMISVSSGIMEGDEQDIQVQVLEGASVTVIGQSYEKIHKMNEGKAKRKTTLTVGREGFLNYSPLPCIPFGNSSFETDTEIFLEDSSSKLLYSEILTCGRVGKGELFKYKEYITKTKLYQGRKLIYFDSGKLIPKKLDMPSIFMFQGYTHLANIIVANFKDVETIIEKTRGIIKSEKEIMGGVSKFAPEGINIKILGYSAEKILKVQERVYEMLAKK